MARRRPICCLRACLLLLLVFGSRFDRAADASEPLHVRIDQQLKQASWGSMAGPAADGEFLRRVYLDLVGMVPPADEARAFLEDKSPDKRAATVDRLLNSPEHTRHLARVLDIMMMERRSAKHVKRAEWEAYLRESVANNKPWDQLAREILGADGTDEKIRAASAFYLFRDGEPNLLTRDTGRVFFGMDMQCCQCHDHPLIDDYYQADYYGLYAFLSRGFLFTEDSKDKTVFFAEKAEGDVKFTSVFTKENGRTRPRLPGDVTIDEPVFAAGEEYVVKPASKVRPIPKHSRRAMLAELATDGTNQRFNRNIVNRLWGHMMGQGLVDPVDLHHPLNPAAHPALLDLLAEAFVEMKFDIRAFLRELALSQTYQLSLNGPTDLQAQATQAAQQLAELTEQRDAAKARLEAARREAAETRQRFDAAQAASVAVADEHTNAKAVVSNSQKKADEAAQKLTEAQAALAAKQDIANALDVATKHANLAAAKLPDEKELVAAAQTIATRFERLNAEVSAAQKQADALKPPAAATAKTLADARQAAAAVAARLQAENKKLDATRQPVRTAQKKFEAEQSSLAQLESQLAFATELVELRQHQSAAQAAGRMLETATADLANTREMLAKITMTRAQRQAAVTDAQAQHQAAESALQQLAAQVAGRDEGLKLVAAAAESARQAAGKLPKDAELKAAADAVQARRAALGNELAELQKQHEAKRQATAVLVERLRVATKEYEEALQQVAQLEQRVASGEAKLVEHQTQLESEQRAAREQREQLLGGWSDRFFASPIVPLSPEQLAWSLMQASGQVDRQRVAAAAEVDKKLPLDPQQPDDPARLRAREQAIEAAVYEKLNSNVKKFVDLFGHAGGQPQTDFFATVDQALFLANAGTLQSWLNPAAGNLTDRLGKIEDPAALAEELYMSVLTRRPSSAEITDVRDYLAERPQEKPAAVMEMAWGLMSSAEFRFRY